MERAVYKALHLQSIGMDTRCREPGSFVPVALDTPAIDVMTDFQLVTPATVRPSATINQATNTMIARGVRLLFVCEADDVILGVVTARDTMGERPITHLREHGGKHEDLRVADIMTPRESIEALPIADVLHAEVGHILQTLKQIGRQHALVVEYDPISRQEEIRGMFSATAIGRHLGVPIQTFQVANTFAEIEAALATT